MFPHLRFAFPVLLSVAAAHAAIAAPLTASSTLTAATVYTDRAIVTRTAAVDLPAGTSEVVFENLPATLVDASLQVSGRGTANATILDVSARMTYVAAEPDPRIKTLEDELLALRRDDRVIADRLAAIEKQAAVLTGIEGAMTAPPTKDNPSPRPSFDDWQKLLAFSADNAARIAADRRKAELERTDLADKIKAAQNQLNELRGGQRGNGRAFKAVTVRLTAATAGKLDLTVAYSVPGASWTPTYDARLRTAERAVELTYFGLVRNATGEDWKDIALTLSTARPGLGGGAPELERWVVDVSRPMAKDEGYIALSPFSVTGGSRPRSDAAAMSSNSVSLAGTRLNSNLKDVGSAITVMDSDLATASVETSTTSVSFKIATATTLASDNTPQKISIATAKLPAVLQYQTTPRLIETAYLSAYVSNATDFPLLAGALNTFLDDTFVATGALKTVMPTEKFQLALGADEGIAVKRRLVNRLTENTGFGSKGVRVTYEFVVTLTNHKSTTERVMFKDVVPVSQNEKIVVKLLAPGEKELLKPEDVITAAGQLPKAGITREEDGKLVWRVDLKPGEKRELPLKFTIEHPADLPVVGLE